MLHSCLLSQLLHQGRYETRSSERTLKAQDMTHKVHITMMFAKIPFPRLIRVSMEPAFQNDDGCGASQKQSVK